MNTEQIRAEIQRLRGVVSTLPSERERQIGALISQGRTTKEIATELGLSPKTVDTHRVNLYRKMSARSQGHLVRLMIERGFLEVGRNA
jgi:DNA-binding CsgD family transcriptional regulator